MVLAPPRNPYTELFRELVIIVLQVSQASSLIVTSWFRTAAENRRVGGVPNSLHLQGLAIDLIGPTGELERVRQIWNLVGLQAFDEGDHLHLELDPL